MISKDREAHMQNRKDSANRTRHVNPLANSTPHDHLFQRIRCSTDELRRIAENTILSPGPLTPNHGFELKARGLWNTCHKRQLFSKNVPDFKQKVEEPRRQLILSLIHRIKPSLRGYFIWSASTSRTIYQDRLGT